MHCEEGRDHHSSSSPLPIQSMDFPFPYQTNQYDDQQEQQEQQYQYPPDQSFYLPPGLLGSFDIPDTPPLPPPPLPLLPFFSHPRPPPSFRIIRALFADPDITNPQACAKAYEDAVRLTLFPPLLVTFDIQQDGLDTINQAHRVDYDIIFLSSSLSTSGLAPHDVSAALRESMIACPIVLVTPAVITDLDQVADRGFNAILKRPLNARGLSGVIKALTPTDLPPGSQAAAASASAYSSFAPHPQPAPTLLPSSSSCGSSMSSLSSLTTTSTTTPSSRPRLHNSRKRPYEPQPPPLAPDVMMDWDANNHHHQACSSTGSISGGRPPPTFPTSNSLLLHCSLPNVRTITTNTTKPWRPPEVLSRPVSHLTNNRPDTNLSTNEQSSSSDNNNNTSKRPATRTQRKQGGAAISTTTATRSGGGGGVGSRSKKAKQLG